MSPAVTSVCRVGHKEPMTIAAALRSVQKNELVLPAIQREFVGKASQVVKVSTPTRSSTTSTTSSRRRSSTRRR